MAEFIGVRLEMKWGRRKRTTIHYPGTCNVLALVLIRFSLNFITVIPQRIIAKDVKYHDVLYLCLEMEV
ncbi:CLUMA_CG006741, isoform A [Clunio marinus]|uniref:CLUMA_CG006741, isoform A n=1 Tax=Clunio marinus TaxID=568069 RepID=A0A1J1HYU5_9DIPT|nr:CLUMA_CG006741, isoform A [Clunio marinus]